MTLTHEHILIVCAARFAPMAKGLERERETGAIERAVEKTIVEADGGQRRLTRYEPARP